MEISYSDLMRGKSTIIKNKEYYPTKFYTEPFFEKMSKYTDNFIIKAIPANQMSVTKEETDIVWNRVWIQAVLPEKYRQENHDEVYGLVYGLDARKPVAKMYRGGLNLACMNLTIFNPSWLQVQELQAEDPINYNPLKELAEKENEMFITLEKMKNNYLPYNLATNELGKWVDFTLRYGYENGFTPVKISNSIVNNAYKQLYIDDKSKYFVQEGEDASLFKVYNAFTELITHDKKDILNTAEKTLLLGRMLDVSAM